MHILLAEGRSFPERCLGKKVCKILTIKRTFKPLTSLFSVFSSLREDLCLIRPLLLWRPKESKTEMENESEPSFSGYFETLFQLRFRLFGRPAPGTHVGLVFSLWARRAQMTPVTGRSFRKSLGVFRPALECSSDMGCCTLLKVSRDGGTTYLDESITTSASITSEARL